MKLFGGKQPVFRSEPPRPAVEELVVHDAERERPFFLAAGTWKPHDPWEIPQKYFDMYPLEKVEL